MYQPFQALKDPKYSIAYANLCKVMSTLKVETPTEEGKVKVITFRRMLLTRVQQKFESKEGDEEKEGMLNTIKEAHDVSSFGLHVVLYHYACEKGMQIGHNRPFKKFILFMHYSV